MSLITDFNIGGFMDLHTKFSIACPPPPTGHKFSPKSACIRRSMHHKTDSFPPPLRNPDSAPVLCVYLTYCNIVGLVASLLSIRNTRMWKYVDMSSTSHIFINSLDCKNSSISPHLFMSCQLECNILVLN